MDRSALADVVCGKITEVLGLEPGQVTEDVNLGEQFEVDSLELMEIGSRIETALHTTLAVEDLATMRRVGDAIDVLHRRLDTV